MKLPDDHIWPLTLAFVVVVAAYVVLGITAPDAGTLLRAVVISLASGVVGYAGGRSSK